MSPLEADLGDLAQAVWPHVREVDRGRQGAQGVIGADVGGRLLTTDVLLARRQGQDEAPTTMRVMGGAHQSAWQLAHQLLPAGDETDVRTAEARSHAELLALTDGDVGAVLAWRSKDSKADGIHASNGQRARVVCCRGQSAGIHEQAEEVGLLEDHGRGLLVRLAALAHLDPACLAEGAQDLDVLRVQVARDQNLVAAVMDVRHHGRLGHGGRSVVQRGVGYVEAGQLGDEGLVLEDRLEGALARLGLVWRVGGVELGLRGHRSHRRRDETAIHAAAAESQPVREYAVACGERRDLRHRLELRQPRRQLE